MSLAPDHPDNGLSFAAPSGPPRPVAGPAPAPGGNPRASSLNLANRPFRNSRPVVRTALILWLLGLLLLLGNVFVFRKYLSDSADKRAHIARGEEELLRQQKNVSDLQNQLNGYDLVRLNDQIDFLNTQIDNRTFSWSLLIDRVADTLPNDVRVNRLTPEIDTKAARESRERSVQLGKLPEGAVKLQISGQTRREEALLQFIRNLFAHPSFRNPNLVGESQIESGPLVRFDVTVTYLPGGPPHSVVVEEAPAGKKITTTTQTTATKTTATKTTATKTTASATPKAT